MDYKQIAYSLIPSWNFPVNNMITTNKIYINKKITNYKEYIFDSYNANNILNNIHEDDLTIEQLNKISYLHDAGIQFHFKTSNSEIIPIRLNDLLFPICCVGKNRSQYLFYYLKKLQSECNNRFDVGYPSSGDELSSLSNLSNSNTTNLSSFEVSYRSDKFSKALNSIYGHEFSRSIHMFDKIIKESHEYELQDLKNFESTKYANNKSANHDDIAELFIKYFFIPTNIRKIINNIDRITYICASPNSFINICNIFNFLKQQDNTLDLRNVRIVYFGIKDIFQRSIISDDILNDFALKVSSAFQYVDQEIDE
jgi:hypothetical protein